MKLAEGGLPKGGGVGYEIFDKSDALGATSFVQNINHLRALEGELSRTIRAIDRVQQARVHLVLPERPLFSRDKAEPSASIVLKVRGTLEAQQVRAIRHLVASAVNGLKPQRVSVVDETGRLLADGSADDAGGGVDRRRAQGRLRAPPARAGRIDRHLGGRPGPRPRAAHRRFRFQPHHPDLGQVRSRKPRGALEPDPRRDHRRAAIPTPERSRSATSCPAPTPARTARSSQRDQNRKTEEIVNYEISRTTKTEVIEGGRINRVSVAVVVDGIYAKNDKGELAYQPRSKEEIDRIAALVRSAIGFDQKRGDQVEVANLRLAETPSIPISEPTGWMSMLQFTKDDIMHWIEVGVMSLLALLVLLLGVRPMIRRIFTPEAGAVAAGRRAHHRRTDRRGGRHRRTGRRRRCPRVAAAVNITGGAAGSITTAGGPNVSIVGSDEAVAISNRTSAMIDIAQVQGQVHAQSVQKVGELADKNPNETVAIIRGWLHENAA